MSIMPNVPDPLWPEGILPTHTNEVEEYAVAVDAWTCEKCGTHVNKSIKDDRYCNICYVTETRNSSLAKATNSRWMEQSEECGLAFYERQPEENDLDWLIWTTYRSYYPLKLPTWTQLADKVGCSVATVIRCSQRWSFTVRLQSWARMTDSDMQESRIKEIREMNTRQVDMAKRLQDKISKAIDKLDPSTMKASDLNSLLKTSAELERRIKLSVEEKVDSTAAAAGTKQHQETKAEDIGDVVKILQSIGYLDNKSIGVEQKTTIVVKEDQ